MEKDNNRITSADKDFVKTDLEHLEKTEEDVVRKPDSIRNLSDVELQKLETKMVRKMDAVIM